MGEFDCERRMVEKIELPFLRNVLIATYCADNFSYLNLVDWYYRRLDSNMIVVILIVLIVFPQLFISISTASRKYLAVIMKSLTRRLRLSPSLAATTFVALANGAPDIFSSAANAHKTESFLMSLGTLLGAFVFTTTFVLMSVVYSVPSQVALPRLAVIKELGFYFYAILFLVILGILRAKTLTVVLMLGLTYIAYLVATAVVEKKLEADRQERIAMAEMDTEDGHLKYLEETQSLDARGDSLNIDSQKRSVQSTGVNSQSVPETELKASDVLHLVAEEIFDPSISRWYQYNQIILTTGGLLTIPYVYNPLLYTKARFLVVFCSVWFTGKMLFISHLPWYVYAASSFAVALLCLVLEALRINKHVTDTIYELIAVFGAMSWIKILSVLIIDFVSFLSFYMSMEELTLAILVIAAGNSIPDFFNNTALALHGEGVMAAMASYSGQTFNTLFGFAANLLLHWKRHGEVRFDLFGFDCGKEPVSRPDERILCMLPKSLLIFILIAMVLVVLITTGTYMYNHGFVLKRFFGVIALCLYLGFVAAITTTSIILKRRAP
jgi:sodium/potassium/calcium exchanger 6